MSFNLFGSDLDAFIRKIVREELEKPIPGLTPGIHSSGLTLTPDGRVRFAAAAGGSLRPAWMAMRETAQTIASSPATFTTIDWTESSYWTDEGSVSSDQFTGVRDQVYLAVGQVQMTPGSGWGPGNPRVRVSYTNFGFGANNAQVAVSGETSITVGLTHNAPFIFPFKATTDPITFAFSQNGGVSVGITGVMMLLAGPAL